jgi:hypothetical protein
VVTTVVQFWKQSMCSQCYSERQRSSAVFQLGAALMHHEGTMKIHLPGLLRQHINTPWMPCASLDTTCMHCCSQLCHPNHQLYLHCYPETAFDTDVLETLTTTCRVIRSLVPP